MYSSRPFSMNGASCGSAPVSIGASRLPRDKGGERQQLAALERQRRRLLVIGAAQIDALLEIDGAAERLVESGIAGGDTLHAGAGIVVAIGTGLVGGAVLRFHKSSPSSTQSMPGLAVSSSCIALVSGFMKL